MTKFVEHKLKIILLEKLSKTITGLMLLVTSVAKTLSLRKNFKTINLKSTTHRNPAKLAQRHLPHTLILKNMNSHNKPSVFCEKCNKSFPTKYKYNEHQKT